MFSDGNRGGIVDNDNVNFYGYNDIRITSKYYTALFALAVWLLFHYTVLLKAMIMILQYYNNSNDTENYLY